VVTPSLGVASVAELVAKARAEPRKQNFGSAGSGTLGHLAADSVNRRLGLGATHIPYKGSNPAAMDLIGGQIDWMMDTPAAVLAARARREAARAGGGGAAALSAVARTCRRSPKRAIRRLEFRIWMGLMAPAGTPEPVLRAIEAGIVEGDARPGAARGHHGAGLGDCIGSGAREFAAFLDKELPKLTAAARAAGVKAD